MQNPTKTIPVSRLTLSATALSWGGFLACVCSAGVAVSAETPRAEALDVNLAETFRFAAAQYEHLLSSLKGTTNFPRTVENGQLKTVAPRDWTSGFFPGSLWLLYEYTGEAKWKTAAQDYTARLEGIKNYGGSHDVGFMLNCSFGNGYRLTPDPHYREVLIQGARTLSTRFKPEVGLIRSWDHGAWKYPVIIDNMMNLELLTWAAREANEPRLREIAIGHADNTRKNHFRPDASTWHVLDYNPTNGAVVKRQTHQGAADDSAWARGQAWGLYGYTMMYRETRRPEYLEQAVKIAQFLLSHPRLPADKVPYWDFDAPGIPNAPRDASAAAIMASALLELGTLAEPAFARQCFETARQQLRSLASPAYRAVVGENGGFLLRHCVGHFPKNSEVDVPINYADYYFLEALLRLRKQVSATGTAPASSPQASVKKTKRSQGDAGSRPQRKAADLRIQPAPALPNVLLLGDSISIGYTLPVRDRLRGEANVFRPVTAAGAAENCADTGKGLAELDRWLAAQPKWDIIHFNWGLHDLKHMKPGAPTPTTSADPNDPPLRTVEEYQANLEKIVTRLRQTGARLVFATTTPVPEGVTNPYRNPEDPARYNAAAAEVMKRHGIRVNDLFSFAQPRLAEIQLSRNVHFTPQGSEAMAKQVAEAIQSELKVQVRPAAVSRP